MAKLSIRTLIAAGLAALVIAATIAAERPTLIHPQGAAAPAGSQHLYFEQLEKRSELLLAASLRDPKQLLHRTEGGYAAAIKRETVVRYDPVMDAAKVRIGIHANSLWNMVIIPIPAYTGSLLVTWDAWFGKEFDYGTSGIPTYKNFMLASGGKIWNEIRSRFADAPGGAIAAVDMGYYGHPGPGTHIGNADTLSPMKGSFAIAPETWTRYWVFLNPAGEWTEISMWIADPRRGPVQLLDRRNVKPRNDGRWDQFWLEYNTSTDAIKKGRPELVSYVRNVVMLHGIGDVTPLLVKPEAGGPVPAR